MVQATMARTRRFGNSGRKRSLTLKPKSRTDEFIDFDVLSEPWNKFSLSDGTKLKLKFVLLKMRKMLGGVPAGKQGATFASQNLIAIEPPPRFHGPPGSPLAPEQIESHIEKEVSIKTLFVAPSTYTFEGGRTIMVSLLPTRVRRTDVYGPDGDRIYLVETLAQVTVMGGPKTVELDAPGSSR
jgi:hypothetical protein